MSDLQAKPANIETCRWSLALGMGLLVASLAAAGLFISRVSNRPPRAAALLAPATAESFRSVPESAPPAGGSSTVPVSSP